MSGARQGAAVRWEHFAHGADAGVRGLGATRAEAFAGAATALTALVTDPERVRARETVEIRCAAPDDELLLVDFLDAVVFELSANRRLLARFDVTIDDHTLRARASGERLDRARHEPAVEPKGATHTALEVARRADGTWVAATVVDV